MAGAILLLTACATARPAVDAAARPAQIGVGEKIAPYQARLDRSRPIIAVIGDNRGTELSDFMVPYGILSQADIADVVAVSTQSGPIATFTDLGHPAFRIAGQTTISDFDKTYPDGADYVIVPAQNDTPELLHWLVSQAGKGAVLVSICNGGMIVAETGIMNGRHATAHWSTEAHRIKQMGTVHWVKNARYVSDGNWVSSAGVSAAIPVSIALVEAIAGHARAAALAGRLGVTDWSAKHDSDAFHLHLGVNAVPLAKVIYTNHWLHADDAIGVPAQPEMDEVALALTVDAYSSTGRSRAFLVGPSDAPLRTRHGLEVLPDRVVGASGMPNHTVMLPSAMPSAKTLVSALDGIAQRYGRATAYGVALVFEYPGFK